MVSEKTTGKHTERQAVEPPYLHSIAVSKLRENLAAGKPLRLAFLDIDATSTGLVDRQQEARRLLEAKGFVVVFVTSRTEEMVMSGPEFAQSEGLQRPLPQLKVEGDRNLLAHPDEVARFQGHIDPDIVAGATGTSIFVRQARKQGGYISDGEFEDGLRADSATWRNNTSRLLQMLAQQGILFEMNPLEDENNFFAGKTDVFPPNFRITVDFSDSALVLPRESTGSTSGGRKASEEESRSGLVRKLVFLDAVRVLRENPETPSEVQSILRNIRIIDDSNPEKGRFSIYITPTKGNKARAVEHITGQLVQALGIKTSDLEVLFAGDSFPDLAMGLYGALGTRATFLLAGGSRLTAPLTSVTKDSETVNFAGEGLYAIRERLTQSGNPGEFVFRTPFAGNRRFIAADQAYVGTLQVESLIAYLEQIQ